LVSQSRQIAQPHTHWRNGLVGKIEL